MVKMRNDCVLVRLIAGQKKNCLIEYRPLNNVENDVDDIVGQVIAIGPGHYDHHYTRSQDERRWTGVKGGPIRGLTEPTSTQVAEYDHFIPTTVEPNKYILFPKFCGDDYTYNGNKCRIIRECEIDAVIEGATNDEEIIERFADNLIERY